MATTFKLDLDCLKLTEFRIKRIKRVLSMLSLKPINIQVYKTKNGFHYYIKVKENLYAIEICLIQALMGSDYKRELFNLIRIKQGSKNWNVLYKKKYRYKKGKLKLIGEEKYIGDKL